MTAFTPFDDERLDANLAAILHLPDRAARPAAIAGGAAPTLDSVRRARRASVTVVAALSIALCGAIVALFAGRGDPPVRGSTTASAHDARRIIYLGGTAVIWRPADPSTVPADATETAPARRGAMRRRAARRSENVTPSPDQPLGVPETPPSPAGVPPAPVAAPAAPPGATVAAPAEKPAVAADASGSAPTATPSPIASPAAASPVASANRDRRDGVSAIRSLRRQW
jgi:hypothetical protein